jgi:hypothetical protein
MNTGLRIELRQTNHTGDNPIERRYTAPISARADRGGW